MKVIQYYSILFIRVLSSYGRPAAALRDLRVEVAVVHRREGRRPRQEPEVAVPNVRAPRPRALLRERNKSHGLNVLYKKLFLYDNVNDMFSQL